MALSTAEIGEILSAASSAVGLIEKYGEDAWETIKTAVETTKASGGPTAAQIDAIYQKCVADNAAIQSA